MSIINYKNVSFKILSLSYFMRIHLLLQIKLNAFFNFLSLKILSLYRAITVSNRNTNNLINFIKY